MTSGETLTYRANGFSRDRLVSFRGCVIENDPLSIAGMVLSDGLDLFECGRNHVNSNDDEVAHAPLISYPPSGRREYDFWLRLVTGDRHFCVVYDLRHVMFDLAENEIGGDLANAIAFGAASGHLGVAGTSAESDVSLPGGCFLPVSYL